MCSYKLDSVNSKLVSYSHSRVIFSLSVQSTKNALVFRV